MAKRELENVTKQLKELHEKIDELLVLASNKDGILNAENQVKLNRFKEEEDSLQLDKEFWRGQRAKEIEKERELEVQKELIALQSKETLVLNIILFADSYNTVYSTTNESREISP